MIYSNAALIELSADQIASNLSYNTIMQYKAKAQREEFIELSVLLYHASLLVKTNRQSGEKIW